MVPAHQLHYGRTHRRHVSGPQLAFAACTFAAAAGLTVSTWTLPAPLILPVLSVFLILAACGMGLVAWLCASGDERGLTYWDVSGALTFVGICLALASEPEQVLPLLQAQPSE